MISDTAVVADIQRGSVHDGPGIRTTVFFKGCPLDCRWCHNPECKNSEPQMLYYPEKCIGCGMCEYGCYSGAKVICGRKMTADEIFSQIKADSAYYGDDGGVTFSGGEPLLYAGMIKSLIEMCRAENIHTAIETSLFLFDSEVLGKLDLVMADLKIFNSDKHREYTGKTNEAIIRNFSKLDKLGVPFIVRTPVIPGVNDTKEEISAIRDFLKRFRNIRSYELLPYHPLGVPKQRALGLSEEIFEIPTKNQMEELMKYADLRG